MTCNKTKYSKKGATTKLNELISSGKWNQKELGRIYPCPICKYWHLTHTDNTVKADMRGVELNHKKKWKKLLKKNK